VYVDGKLLDEPYLPPARRDHQPARTWHVPPGEYFLVGDNRSQFCDPRIFGAVPKKDLIGKVVVVSWPPSRTGFR
jgi:signal peptidase I